MKLPDKKPLERPKPPGAHSGGPAGAQSVPAAKAAATSKPSVPARVPVRAPVWVPAPVAAKPPQVRLVGTEVAPGVFVSDDDLRLQYARSSGPGGQNVNKVNTKTELWIPVAAFNGLSESARARLTRLAGHRLTQAGEIHIAADNNRTQEANRGEAFDRLRELLLEAMHEPKRRRKTKPSRGAKQRRIESKKRRGAVKSNRRYSED